MKLCLKQAFFLAGRCYPAGALVDDYQAPLADWMEPRDLAQESAKTPSKRRRTREP